MLPQFEVKDPNSAHHHLAPLRPVHFTRAIARGEELLHQLHLHFSDPGPETKNSVFDMPQQRQIEVFNGTENRSYRYDRIYSEQSKCFLRGLAPLYRAQHPGMNLAVESELVRVTKSILGGLEGKNVVHLRPEYFPFFGLQAATLGANTRLIDSRTIPHIEALIRGSAPHSLEAVIDAEQRSRDIRDRRLFDKGINTVLAAMPLAKLASSIAQSEHKLSPEVWSGLSLAEQNHYILSTFATMGHNMLQYYGFDLQRTDVDTAAFVVRALEEGGETLLRDKVSFLFHDGFLRSSSTQALSENEYTSLAYSNIYGRIVEYTTDSNFISRVQQVMCQSDDPQLIDAAMSRLTFQYGSNLGNAGVAAGSVDALFCGWGLDHLENIGDFLDNARRAISPEGLLVGYVKRENTGSARRDLRTPEKLSRFLAAAGFSAPIIVVEEPEHPGDFSNRQNPGLLYFARPDEQHAQLETRRIYLQAPASKIFSDANDPKLTEMSPSSITPLLSVTCEAPDLESCALLLESSPGALEEITTALYGENLASLDSTDCSNVALALRWHRVEGDCEIPESVDTNVAVALKAYLDRQMQVYGLLTDVKQFVTSLNRYENTETIEATIVERAKLLDVPQFMSWLRGIKYGSQRTDLSADALESLRKELSSLESAAEDAGNSFRFSRDSGRTLENLLSGFLTAERDEAFFPGAKLLFDYFAEEQMWCDLTLAPGGLIEASLGTVDQHRAFEFNGDRLVVNYVNERLSRNFERLGVCLQMGEESEPITAVFLATAAEQAGKLHKSLANEEPGPLIAKQWNAKTSAQEILEDLCHSIAAHELMHLITPSEIGAAFAEVGFGRVPYESLRGMLDMTVGGPSNFISRALTRGSDAERDKYVSAGALVIGTLLSAALSKGTLELTQEQRLKQLITPVEGGFFLLNWEKVRSERHLIETILSSLDEGEIRQITQSSVMGTDQDDLKRANIELSTPLPLPTFHQSSRGSADWSPALSQIETDREIKAIVKQVLLVANPGYRLASFLQTATQLARVSSSDAQQFINSVEWEYAQGRAAVEVAKILVDRGNSKTALEFLRSGERLLAPQPFATSDSFPFYSSFGDTFLIFDDLMSVKLSLGLQDEAIQSCRHFLNILNYSDVDPQVGQRYSRKISRILFEVGDRDGGRVALRTLQRFVASEKESSSEHSTESDLIGFAYGPKKVRMAALSRLMIHQEKNFEILNRACKSRVSHLVNNAAEFALLNHWIDRYGHSIGVHTTEVSERIDDYSLMEFAELQYRLGRHGEALKNVERALDIRRRLSENSEDYRRHHDEFLKHAVVWMTGFDELMPRALNLARSIESDFASRTEALRAILENRMHKASTAETHERAVFLAQAEGLIREILGYAGTQLDRLVLERYLQNIKNGASA